MRHSKISDRPVHHASLGVLSTFGEIDVSDVNVVARSRVNHVQRSHYRATKLVIQSNGVLDPLLKTKTGIEVVDARPVRRSVSVQATLGQFADVTSWSRYAIGLATHQRTLLLPCARVRAT